MIPLWVVCGALAALFIAFMPVYSERAKADPYALAFWNKVFCAIWATPFALMVGLPSDPAFYAIITAMAALWCVSDIFYFRAVPHIGAGVMTRLLPGTVIVTFVLWFFFDPALLDKYLSQPLLFSGICAMIALAAISAAFLKRCRVSMAAVRRIWFVLFAACIGPIGTKLALAHVDPKQGALAVLSIQSAIMVVMWLVWAAIAKPVPRSVMLNNNALTGGLIVSFFCGIFILLKTYALQFADNPAYVSVLLFTDAFWVLLIYKLIGRKETANVVAGLGIVASALGLVLIKSFVQ